MHRILIEAFHSLLVALAFRSLPFGVAAALSDSLPGGRRLAVVGAFLAFFWALALGLPVSLEAWTSVGAVYAYFVVLSVLAWWLAVRRLRSPRFLVFTASAGLGLVVPGVLAWGMGRSFALVLGFEYLFKVASYVDSARTDRRSRTLGDALEFLVVNPVLVYAERGERSVELPSVTAAGARWLAGAATLYVHFIGTAAVPDALQVYRLSLLRYGVATAASLGAGVTWLQLVFWYLGHSGTASLQIAGMRALGVPLPERYRAPFLARTPEDFWRRWNTYLGSWLMRYVFMPAGAFLLRRRTQRGGGKAEKAIAVVFTFGACGLAHELVKVVEFGRLSGGALVGFLFGGLVLIGWKGAELLVRSRRGAPSRDGVWSAVRAGAARLAMVCLVAMMGLAFLPGLSGVPLHQQLRLLLTGW